MRLFDLHAASCAGDTLITIGLAGTIAGLESVGGFGGKAVTLAEGALYSNNPAAAEGELAQRLVGLAPPGLTR